MGIVISRFRRKKTTQDVLEKLDKEIRQLEEYGVTTEQKHKRVIGYVMAFSVGLYVLFAAMYYFMYAGHSHNFAEKIMYASPLLLLPVLVLFLRSAISRYFNWSIGRNRTRLGKMRDQKRLVLEDVMNTEKYKVAKEILDKYGNPDQGKALKPFVPSLDVPGNETLSPIPATPGQLRKRQMLSVQTSSTPLTHKNDNNGRLSLTSNMPPRPGSNRLPYPILDANGSVLSKVVDYLVKDGPNYRMALICSHCQKHNGVARASESQTNDSSATSSSRNVSDKLLTHRLTEPYTSESLSRLLRHAQKETFFCIPDQHGIRFTELGMCLFEEFDYASYECWFCHRLTAARRRRPPAPQLAVAQLTNNATPLAHNATAQAHNATPQARNATQGAFERPAVTFASRVNNASHTSHVGGGDESSSSDTSSSDSEDKPDVPSKASDADSGTEETPKADEEKKCD